jgi:hypothetical protein
MKITTVLTAMNNNPK